MTKSKEIENWLNTFTENNFGVKRTDAINDCTCVLCKNPAVAFRDTLSFREFTISGMCQDCQDSFFGGEE